MTTISQVPTPLLHLFLPFLPHFDYFLVPPPENRMTSLFSGLEMRGSDEEDDLLKTHQPLARNKFNLTKPDSDDEITPIPEGEEEKDILEQKEDLKDLGKAESDPEPGNHKENNLSSDSEEAITTVKPNLDRESSNSEANSEEEGQPTDRMSLYDAIMEKTNNNNKDLVKNIIKYFVNFNF